MNKAHSPINWENYPNETTPINEGNLNKMDRAIGIIDDRVIEQETKKLSKADASSDIVNVEYDKDTSVFQFTKRNGDTVKVDVSSVVVREGYTKEESDQRYANVIKRTYADKNIVATDSADAKFEGLRVFGRSEQASTTGKNLCPCIAKSTTIYGITVTVNDDGTIKLNGTATDNVWFSISGNFTLPSGTYAVQLLPDNWDNSYGYLIWNGTGGQFKNIITTLNEETSCNLSATLYKGATLNNVVLKPQVEIGSVWTEYEPYTGGKPSPNPDYPQAIESVGDDGSIDVGVYGKNFININKASTTYNGITYTVNGDGSVTLNGTASEDDISMFNLNYVAKTKSIPVGDYIVSGGYSSNIRVRILASGTSIAGSSGKNVHFTIKEEDTDSWARIHVDKGTVCNNITIYPMVRLASIEDDTFEKGKEPQTLIASTPNGLPGIKVTDASLATYTDQNGIMWVADEVDFDRGKYVQRVKKVTPTLIGGGYHSNGNFYAVVNADNKIRAIVGNMCSKAINGRDTDFMYSDGYHYENASNFVFTGTADDTLETLREKLDGMELLYILAEPIETDLTSEEIEAYRALNSNYPTTTILNDENAYMEVVLVADTKNHIEQNYVPKSEFLSVVDRVSALEQRALA